ncbi:hypothetical protein ASG07_10350 [Sphingomonas sp. Leaf343]|nr:hypothetical protein ASG07_10350 [Sphingomonas sp. Leaf343]
MSGPAGGTPIAVPRLMVIVAAALLTRALTLGNPIVYSDEEFYFAAARAIGNGAVPFVDIWDRKPVGLFALYLLPAALAWPWGIWLYQALALTSAAATAWLIARLADRAGWSRGGTTAGVAYLAWLTVAGGQGGQSPVFYNLFVAMAAWFATRSDARARDAIAAMLLVGVAIQIKYTAGVEGVWIGLWLMHRCQCERGAWSAVARGALLVGIALIPTLAVALYYVAIGEWTAFFYANVLSILGRRPDAFGALAGNLAICAVILGPLLAMAVLRGPIEEGDVFTRRFLKGWLTAALIAFALVAPWFDHYTLPVMVPAAALAAGFLARQDQRRIGYGLIALVVVIGQVSLVVDRVRRGTPTQFATLAHAMGSGPGCLYVYSSSTMLYPATGRCSLSRYVFPSHLTRVREQGAIGVDQATELRRVMAAGPSVVVVGPPYKGERASIRALALALIARDYRLTARVTLGRKSVAVYARRAPGHTAAVARFD